jgi:hypothetical protein
MEPISAFLKQCKLARKQSYKNLTVLPLLAPNGTKPDYLTLEQGLDQNLVQITELDQDGSVPELRLRNKSKKKLLIVEGEELVGAKQNRIVNATFLVAGNTEIVIPVSCVEQGRWHYESDKFSSGRKMMHASLRRNHQADVQFSLKSGEGYRSNQGRIWEDIEGKLDRMKVAAPTSALSDAYESYEGRLSDYLEKFRVIEWQLGAVFAINGQVLGLECFGCSDTFTGFFDRLVKSYALDALDWLKDSTKDSVPPEKARRFVQSAANSKGESHPSIGIGQTITLESRVLSGAVLVDGDRVFHLSAFKKDTAGGSATHHVRYQRYSQRRRNR